MKIRLTGADALIVTDVQLDFLPGGALAIPGGEQVIAPLNGYIRRFAAAGNPIFLTRDWHPDNHLSFVREGDLAGAGLDFGLAIVFRQLIGHVQIRGVGGSDEMRTHAKGIDGEARGQPGIDRVFIDAAAHEDLNLLQVGFVENFSDGQRL